MAGRVLGSCEGAGDGGSDVRQGDAAVGVVGCASGPFEFAVVADGDGAPVGLVGVGGGENGSGIGAGLGDAGRESVPVQGEANNLGEREAVVAAHDRFKSGVVRVEDLDSDADEPGRVQVGALGGPVLPGDVAGGWADGRSVWSAEIEDRDLVIDHLEIARAEPPDRIRILLDLAERERDAVVRRRRYSLDGKPVLLSASWLPVDIAAGTRIEQPDTGPGGIYARLAEAGHAPAQFREDLRARMPEPDETEHLKLPAGTPVVEIARIARTKAGRIIEVNEMTADATAYIFRYDFSPE
jgi:GntR family transcriptional regulator